MKAVQISFDGKDIKYSILEKMYRKRDREIRFSKKKPGRRKEK